MEDSHMKLIHLLICAISLLLPISAMHSMEKLGQQFILSKHTLEKKTDQTFKQRTSTTWNFFEKKDHEKVGSITLSHNIKHSGDSVDELDTLDVEKKFRKHGLGSLLFKHIIEDFKEKGYTSFSWSAHAIEYELGDEKEFAQAQEKLVQWYERQGGKVDGTHRGAYAMMYYTITE
jgi:GNAT superfamily N-acetyltransferase